LVESGAFLRTGGGVATPASAVVRVPPASLVVHHFFFVGIPVESVSVARKNYMWMINIRWISVWRAPPPQGSLRGVMLRPKHCFFFTSRFVIVRGGKGETKLFQLGRLSAMVRGREGADSRRGVCVEGQTKKEASTEGKKEKRAGGAPRAWRAREGAPTRLPEEFRWCEERRALLEWRPSSCKEGGGEGRCCHPPAAEVQGLFF
jgi:hypothetical protein